MAMKQLKRIMVSLEKATYFLRCLPLIDKTHSCLSLPCEFQHEAMRYYQEACVFATLEGNFWQQEFRRLQDEHQECVIKLQQMDQRCKDLVYECEALRSNQSFQYAPHSSAPIARPIHDQEASKGDTTTAHRRSSRLRTVTYLQDRETTSEIPTRLRNSRYTSVNHPFTWCDSRSDVSNSPSRVPISCASNQNRPVSESSSGNAFHRGTWDASDTDQPSDESSTYKEPHYHPYASQ
jgi:hypothetical protein